MRVASLESMRFLVQYTCRKVRRYGLRLCHRHREELALSGVRTAHALDGNEQQAYLNLASIPTVRFCSK